MNTGKKPPKISPVPLNIGNILTTASIGVGICLGLISISITLKQIVPPLPPTSLFYFLRNMGNKAVLPLILYIWAMVSSLIYISLEWKPFYNSAFMFTLIPSSFIAVLGTYYPLRLYIMAGLVPH